MAVLRVISGGQTGADRGAPGAAQAAGIPCGGYCPKGWCDEDGRKPDKYPLHETASEEYPARTEKNVRASDATLILIIEKADRGTALTERLCRKWNKHVPIVDLGCENLSAPIDEAFQWLAANNVSVLNVAGNRESLSPGLEERSKRLTARLPALR
jgi:hypothetical protein